MKKGTELVLKIEKFADRGKSLSRINGYVVFVAGAVPGDTIKARIFKKKKGYAEARMLELITPSPLRTESTRCKYANVCGGCKWQHVQYPAQIDAKHQSVAEALGHHGQFENLEVNPTLGSEHIYGYRNKMEFSFSAQRWLTTDDIKSGVDLDKNFALGLHVPGRWDKVLDIDECHLHPLRGNDIVNLVRSVAKENGWAPYHAHEHKGFLRHLVIRIAGNTDDIMVNIVTSNYDESRMALLAEKFKAEIPEISTFVNTINKGVAQTAFGEETFTIYGPGVMYDTIGKYKFEVSPGAFFQTNTKQAEKLYEVARDFADLKPDDLVYDLYCGAGTISIFLSEYVKEVVGVELIDIAVQNANANAKANGVENCTFVAGDMLKMFTPKFVEKYGKPDVMIVDPPRAGMHKKVVKQIANLKPERLVYVSCNPISQAIDLALLKEVYEIEAVQPVDLFPHTHHVENVVKLRLKKEDSSIAETPIAE